MNWLSLGLLSVLFFAFSRILQRVLMKDHDSDPLAYSVVFQITVSLIIFLYALTTGFNLSGYEAYWPSIILMAILYAIGAYLFMLSFKLNSASTASIVFSSISIWGAIFSIIFLGETLSLLNILGIILIVAAIIIDSHQKSGTKRNWKNLAYPAAAALFMGIAYVNDLYIIGDRNSQSYLAIAFFFPALLQFLFVKNRKKNFGSILKPSILIKMLLLSAVYGIANILLFAAYQMGGKGAVLSPMSQISVVLTVLLAALFLNERENLFRKICASLLCLLAVYLLVL